MSSAKGKSRGWTGFLDRGKRKDTDPASSTRPPTLSFDDPTFDEAHRFSTPGDRTLLDGVPSLNRDADTTIPPDDVPAGASSAKNEHRIGISPERTELVDAAALGLDFERESTDRHARPSDRELDRAAQDRSDQNREGHAQPDHDTDRPAPDTDPPPADAASETSELKASNEPAPRADTNEDAPPDATAEADPEKKSGRFKGMSFRPIRERNRTASRAREVSIPSEITKSDEPPRVDAQLLRLDAPAGIKPPDAVKIGDDDAELTMLHPAVAIGIAPTPGASPRVPPPDGKLRVPEPSSGPALELPAPDPKAPGYRIDKPDSPLSRLEPEEPKDYNPLTDNDPALEAAVWATDNLARLKTTFKIIPISMIAGLMLAGIFVSTQSAIRGTNNEDPNHTTGTLVTPTPEPAPPTKATPPPPDRAPKTGVAITSAPPYAMVSVNGAEIGRTPLVLPPPERDVGLKIRVSADDHKPWDAEITLKEDFGGIIAISSQSYTGTATSAPKDQRSGRHVLEIRLQKTGP